MTLYGLIQRQNLEEDTTDVFLPEFSRRHFMPFLSTSYLSIKIRDLQEHYDNGLKKQGRTIYLSAFSCNFVPLK